MSRTMVPAAEGRVWTSTTSSERPEDRVAGFVTFASVTARAGNASASASAGAKRMLLYMGDLLVLRISSDVPSRAATERPFPMALGRLIRWPADACPPYPPRSAAGPRETTSDVGPPRPATSFQVRCCRDVARILRRGEELLRIVAEELAHARDGFHDRVHQLAVLPLDLPYIDVEDGFAVLVELDRADGALRQLHGVERFHEGLLVLELPLDRLQRLLEEEPRRVCAHRVEAGNDAVLLLHRLDELLVVWRVQRRRVPARRVDADRLVAHVLQDPFVDAGRVPEHRQLALQPELRQLPQETQTVRSCEAGVETFDVGLQVAEIRSVIGHVERRPELLHDLAARVLVGVVESRRALMTVGEVVGHGGDLFQAELLRRELAEDVGRLRRGPDGVDDVLVLLLLREVVLRRRGRGDERHRGRADVVVDGEGLEGGERPDDDVDLLALDELLGPRLRHRGLPARVGDDEDRLASAEHVVALLEEEIDPFLHLPPAGGERPRADAEEPDPDRLALRRGARRETGCGGDCRGENGAGGNWAANNTKLSP